MILKKISLFLPLFWIPLILLSQEKQMEKILQLQHAYCNAVTEKDSLYLEQLFHEKMIVTSTSGERRDKKKEIRDALDPNYKVRYFRTQDTEVHLYDSTAVVHGDLHWKMTGNGNVYSNKRRYTFIYVKFDEGWRIVGQHIGLVPNK